MNHHISIRKAEPNVGDFNFSHLLDAPAGKHGFVSVKDGHMYYEDGTRARFIGFNMVTRSCTPDHAAAEKLAKRFASMGVNVIRLHAADAPVSEEPCSWSSAPGCALLDYEHGSSRVFTKEGRDRFDYFFAKLKEQGIYLHIDLIVARQFLEADDIGIDGDAPACLKRYPMYNERLIELQKEYARELLTHVNPYTGLSIAEDPAVMTVQLTNEESAINGTMGSDALPQIEPYRQEVIRLFSEFLLKKYESREGLVQAWTKDGACCLGEDEDPAAGTVRVLGGAFYQPNSDAAGSWESFDSPARYADFIEFGTKKNREFYGMMKEYVRSLGVRVPVATSNLTAGAADVYGHTDGDVMEQDCYFNHPIFPVDYPHYMVSGPAEYVSTNPLTIQRYIGSMGTTLTSFGAVSATADRAFTAAEWNEYGLHPFHSTAFMHMVCYACFNDWDGLIVYNYHTSEQIDDQPADEVQSVFDAYNDPALIEQFGLMAMVFLKGLIRPAKTKAEVAVTKKDLLTFPAFADMPNLVLPYITGMRNRFLEDDAYTGDADLAVNKGHFDTADLSGAAHSVWYAWNAGSDPWHMGETGRLNAAAEGCEAVDDGVFRDERKLVFSDIQSVAGTGDYTVFAQQLTDALRAWGLLDADAGLVDGALVSDTKELVFDPQNSRFCAQSEPFAYFSGDPSKGIRLGGLLSIDAKNERLSAGLLSVDGRPIGEAKKYLMTAIGKTGTDETKVEPGVEMMGFPMTMVTVEGKLYMETLEGEMTVAAPAAVLRLLDVYGNEIGAMNGEPADGGVRFVLDGSVPAAQYVLEIC